MTRLVAMSMYVESSSANLYDGVDETTPSGVYIFATSAQRLHSINNAM